MADVDDVMDALALKAYQTLYPTGTGDPSAVGVDVVIFPGTPLPSDLDKKLSEGKVVVTVFPFGDERNTTRYQDDWYELLHPEETLTAVADYNAGTVTIGGTYTAPENVAIIVDNVAVSYRVGPSDTSTTIATALSALLVTEGVDASNVGPVITIVGAKKRIIGRVGAIGTLLRELTRQERIFGVTVWAPSPELRRSTAGLLDVEYKKLNFIQLIDTTVGRIIYKNTAYEDRWEKQALYRRVLFYTVDWATTEIMEAAEILVAITNVRHMISQQLLVKIVE